MNKVGELRQCVEAAVHEASLKVTINVGSEAAFLKAMDAYCGGLVKTDTAKVTAATFCGVDIRVNEILPPNMAAVLRGDKLINLIKFTDD